jgi:hypothetical protein
MDQAGVGDRSTAEVERLQLDEIAKVSQAGVSDPGAVELTLPMAEARGFSVQRSLPPVEGLT